MFCFFVQFILQIYFYFIAPFVRTIGQLPLTITYFQRRLGFISDNVSTVLLLYSLIGATILIQCPIHFV